MLVIVAAYETIEAMILPKFSLRTLLIATAVCGVLSLVLAQAVRGEAAIAIAFLVAAGSVVLAFGLYCWAFAAAWGVSWLSRSLGTRNKGQLVTSPFADAGPPKQIVTPVDPE